MARIGTTEIQTESGAWLEVDVYEPADFPDSPVEVLTENGWGVLNVTSATVADSPFEVQTTAGDWRGINLTGYTALEDFESGDLDNWVESQSAGVDVSSARAAFQGTYGLVLEPGTCENIISAPDFSPGFPHYPAPGHQFDIFWRPYTQAAADAETHAVHFGMQGWPNSTGFGSVDDNDAWGDSYRVAIQTYQDQLRIQDNHAHGDFNSDLAIADTPSFEEDQWYRLQVDWHYSNPGEIIVTNFEVTKDDWDGEQHSQVSVEDDRYGEGAVMLAGIDVHYDLLRHTQPV